MKERDGSIVPL